MARTWRSPAASRSKLRSFGPNPCDGQWSLNRSSRGGAPPRFRECKPSSDTFAFRTLNHCQRADGSDISDNPWALAEEFPNLSFAGGAPRSMRPPPSGQMLWQLGDLVEPVCNHVVRMRSRAAVRRHIRLEICPRCVRQFAFIRDAIGFAWNCRPGHGDESRWVQRDRRSQWGGGCCDRENDVRNIAGIVGDEQLIERGVRFSPAEHDGVRPHAKLECHGIDAIIGCI